VVLVLYLAEVGRTPARIGLLLTLNLLGDTAVSLWVATRADRADRAGRRRMLVLGAALMAGAGVLYAALGAVLLLLFTRLSPAVEVPGAGMARTVGASLAPVLAGPLYAAPGLVWVPFAICGALKIGYDLVLWRAFVSIKPLEERGGERS